MSRPTQPQPVDTESDAWSFDVAVVPVGLGVDGRRDIGWPRWSRVVVSAEGLVEAHLLAAQLAGARGMVVEVLYRE